MVLSFRRPLTPCGINYTYGVDGRLLDRSNNILGERIALIAAPVGFRGLCIEAWNMRLFALIATASGPM